MNSYFRKLNPFKIIILWLAVCIVITLIGIILLGVSTPGGAQEPFTFLANMIKIIIYGVLLLSIISIPFYLKWTKRFWFINLFFSVLCCLLIYENWSETQKEQAQYSQVTIPVSLGNNQYIQKRTEYYGMVFTKLRSISFMRDNKKDSLWTTYAEDGSIIKQVRYKNDTLVEIIK